MFVICPHCGCGQPLEIQAPPPNHKAHCPECCRDFVPRSLVPAPLQTAPPSFGLAARNDGAEKLTHDGTVLGTPLYMAPEQAAGRSADVGPASDQYSLGVLLDELLCGRTPFIGAVEMLLMLHQHEAVPAPRRHAPSVPRDLETICLRN